MMCGGFKQLSDIDSETQELIMQLKPDIETQLGKSLTEFTPIQFRSQVVAGINYLVKVRIDNNEYLHVKIHSPLPCHNKPPSLMDVQPGHTLESDLSP